MIMNGIMQPIATSAMDCVVMADIKVTNANTKRVVALWMANDRELRGAISDLSFTSCDITNR